MTLLIAIPALNEQDSIRKIIERTLEASQKIIANSPVTRVEITVVSDGSTDRTVEIASAFQDRIRLIVFPKNRGYGAAIQEAWDNSDAELLGFLDADGTCDPNFFADLCRELDRQHADLILGCRLGRDTKMPAIRKAGNFIFGSLLTLLSGKRVRDTASGMRVLRRATYQALLPLPNGLHFTPAMSARAVLGPSGSVKLIELDMPYHEREGISKLHVVRDGFRFLRIILEALFLYRPFRPLFAAGMLALAIAISIMLLPIVHYATVHRVEEWMIHRFILGHLFATLGVLLLSLALLTRLIARIAVTSQYDQAQFTDMERAFLRDSFWLLPLALFLAGTLLVFPEPLFRHNHGITNGHWSRFIVMSFCYLAAAILLAARAVAYFLKLVAIQHAYSRPEPIGGDKLVSADFPVS